MSNTKKLSQLTWIIPVDINAGQVPAGCFSASAARIWKTNLDKVNVDLKESKKYNQPALYNKVQKYS